MHSSWLENYNLLIFNRLDSTNSEAFRLIKNNMTGNFVIVAREQIYGKGSKGKFWKSSAGNLYMSILAQPKVSIERIKELPFLIAIILRKTIIDFISKSNSPKSDIKLKWPNDVLINGKKLAGILIESTHLDSVNHVVIGVGVNTHFVPDITKKEVTSLLNEGIILKNSDYFLSSFMSKFQTYYSKWIIDDNFDVIRKEWLKSAYNLNNAVTFNDGKKEIFGVFKGIDQEGAIIIESSNRKMQKFSSGQVSFC